MVKVTGIVVITGSRPSEIVGWRVAGRGWIMSRTRRLVVALTVAVVVISLLGATVWFVFLPNWRPPLRAGEQFGIDVSSHQGSIQWPRVAADDIRFAYIKATEGSDFTDQKFADNWRGAGAAGLRRGAYHYFTLCTPGADQAANFLRIAPPDARALPPAVNLELVGNCASRPSRAELERELAAFIGRIELAWHVPVMPYVGDEWERMYPSRNRLARRLWQLRVLRRPHQAQWVVWQVHGLAHIEGIKGRVDLDVMRKR